MIFKKVGLFFFTPLIIKIGMNPFKGFLLFLYIHTIDRIKVVSFVLCLLSKVIDWFKNPSLDVKISV